MVRPCCCSVQEAGPKHKHRRGEDSCSEVFSKLCSCQKSRKTGGKWLIHMNQYVDTKGKRYKKIKPNVCVYRYKRVCAPYMRLKHENKLHNQLMELRCEEDSLIAAAYELLPLTSVARGCGEAGRARGARLLAPTGRPASKLMHNTHTHIHTHSLVLR